MNARIGRPIVIALVAVAFICYLPLYAHDYQINAGLSMADLLSLLLVLTALVVSVFIRRD